MTEMSSITEKSLLNALIGGDRKAFIQIYEYYWLPLLLHAERMLNDEQQAQDVVQDVFVMLWEKRDTLIIQSSIKGFLYAATRNRILNVFKKEKVKANHFNTLANSEESETIQTDYLIREKELEALIESEIEKLPPKMRTVFLLKRKDQLSYKEISTTLGISDLTVKTQMNKAIKILRLRLEGLRILFF
ncbi:hypothetical protein CA265_11710 [Sphingobacteriaceae bacterium GW460-11-11-14-LB5]|nr:hypothetical protein CA265_11710 [Sphingobacteriaceae bacterium GW460-11-11-14-LB5]